MSGDRRNKLLSLTARGEELLRLAVEPTLSMEERRTFLDLSHRYLNRHSGGGGAHPQGQGLSGVGVQAGGGEGLLCGQ